MFTDVERPFTPDDDDVDSGREDNLDDEDACLFGGGGGIASASVSAFETRFLPRAREDEEC